MPNGVELVLVLSAVLVPPLVVILALGALVDWVRRSHDGVIARQARLTDAVHSRLGAIVAPVVSKRLNGPWVVSLAIPPEHLIDVGRLVGIVRQVLSPGLRRDADLRIVLSVLGEHRRRTPTRSPSPLAGTLSRRKAA